METNELSKSEFFINRELSLLEFNIRVLAQAKNKEIPLLERLNYLCISSSNLDEFYEVRVASVLQMVNMDPGAVSSDGLTPAEQLDKISTKAHPIVEDQYRVLNDILIPQLEKEKIRFIRRDKWSDLQKKMVREVF